MELFRKCQFLNWSKAGGHQVGIVYPNRMKQVRKRLSNSKDENVPLSLLELSLQLRGAEMRKIAFVILILG